MTGPPNKAQRAAVTRLQERDPHIELDWNETLGIPRRLKGNLSSPVEADPLSVARRFLDENRELFQLQDVDRELEIKRSRQDAAGNTHIRLQQTWQGIPVFGSQLVVHVALDNSIQRINGDYHPNIQVASEPSIPPEKAIEAARIHAEKATEVPGKEPKLEVFHQGGVYTLCWHVTLDGTDGDGPALWEYFVDAENAEVVFRYNNLQFHTAATGWGRGRYAGCLTLNTYHNHAEGTYQLRDTSRTSIEIKTYDMNGNTDRDALTLSSDANNQWNNTNRVPRRNSQEAEVDAHHYTGVVVDYYLNTFGRNGWDDLGSDAEVCVHYGVDLTGSFWDPSRHRVYHPDGDGVAVDYKPALDVVAHEFTHGVTQSEVDFNYWGESGSLCEAYSDFFACMIQEDWVFEEEVYLGASAPDDALRSLYDPTLYGAPDHYSDIGVTMHKDSGIVTKAGYLMTHGGTHHGVEVFGLGRRITEQIWYQALQNLTSSSDFADFREALEDACDDLYPDNAWRKAIVQNAMAAVGIGNTVQYPSCPTLQVIEPCTYLRQDICVYRFEAGPCLYQLETVACPYVQEMEPTCPIRTETVICAFRDEVEGIGPCCSRELIVDPGLAVCRQGDIPMFTTEGCQRENLIIGRLTEHGRIEPLNTRAVSQIRGLRHTRLLTQRRKDDQ